MAYLSLESYEYIMNKYHAQDKPFDGFARFIRNDGLFDPATGEDGDRIMEELLTRDAALSHLPHAVRKAKALAYVLENMRLSCDGRDPFPALNAIDRPLSRTLIQQWKGEVFSQRIPEIGARRSALEKAGAVTIWPDYDHSVPDWERVLSLGFSGILADCRRARQSRAQTAESDAFFEGVAITYEAVIALVGRLADLAERTEGCLRSAKALRQLETGAPRTFYEALLCNYLYFMVSEHVDGLQVRSLSNFDRIYGPYFQRDLQAGIPKEELGKDLAAYLLQFSAIGNYWNQPVFLGGTRADGESEINELSYFFLDVYDEMRLYNPKIQIKVAENTPKEFLFKALDMVRRGHNSIVFVCEETITRALVRMGVAPEDARLCNIRGCYEYAPQESYSTDMNYLNLLKPLEYALHEGKDGVTGEAAGLPCPPVSQYGSMDALFAEYKRQLGHLIDETVEVVNGFEGYLSEISPLSLLSGTYSSCMEKGKDALAGGVKYSSATMAFGFLADLADSFTMLEKYVFDEGRFTPEEFVRILDNNWEGQELLRGEILAQREKYGNNKDRPDGFAVAISEFIAERLGGRKTAELREGTWTWGYHVARMSYVQGGKTAASPNGRKLGDELSKNLTASMGQNREGATAAVLTVTKVDASAFVGDGCLDMGLLPSAVKGEDGLLAMYGLLRVFCKRGGHALQINVFDGKILRDAQAHPENYRDLQIRVCGWNVLWNDISPKEQEGFIRQAEELI